MRCQDTQLSFPLHFLFTDPSELQVTVSPTPLLDSLSFPVLSSLTLTCGVQGAYLPISYQWNSSCDGACFVSNQTSQSISQIVLRAIDSGTHSCSATDYLGHNGIGSLRINITGTSITLGSHIGYVILS